MTFQNLAKKIKPFVNISILLIVVLFIYFFIKDTDFSKLANLEINFGYLALSSAIALGFRYWGAYIWVFILKQLGAEQIKLNVKLASVYSQAWLGRYIPGTAPWILGKIYFAAAQGISKKKLSVGALLEGALQVVVLLSLSLLFLVFENKLNVFDPRLKIFLLIVAVAVAIIVYPPVFNGTIRFVAKFLKKTTIEDSDLPSNKSVLKGAGLYAIGFLISGLSYFYLVKSIYPGLSFDELPFVMGAFNLAGALGMLAIFTPSGLGVREGSLFLLLAPLLPTEVVVVIVVLARIWGLGIDLLFFAVNKLLDWIYR